MMAAQRQYLIELDQRNGDGDLGISMSDGFAAASAFVNASEETDLGKLLVGASKVFNEAAPSSLGTIMSLCMMGMARTLKGHETADTALVGEALVAGVAKIMERANSKPGEKTVLDALDPAARALCEHSAEGAAAAWQAAAKAAAEGSDSTANMRMLAGYLAPTAGEVELCGLRMSDSPREVKRMIGYLPEIPPLYPESTVTEHLRFVCALRGVAARETARECERVCALLNITHAPLPPGGYGHRY